MDMAAIADAADAIDPTRTDVQGTYWALAAQTVAASAPSESRYSRTRILHDLGAAAGLAALSLVRAAISGHPSFDAAARDDLMDLINGDSGLDLSHADTRALLTAWRDADPDAGHKTLYQMLLDLGAERQVAKWPGLLPGHIQNAWEMRAMGEL